MEERGSLCHSPAAVALSPFLWGDMGILCSLGCLFGVSVVSIISGYFRKSSAPLVTVTNRVTPGTR